MLNRTLTPIAGLTLIAGGLLVGEAYANADAYTPRADCYEVTQRTAPLGVSGTALYEKCAQICSITEGCVGFNTHTTGCDLGMSSQTRACHGGWRGFELTLPLPDYGEGGAVACYILDRQEGQMPGWTMLWKDTRRRSVGCENVLQSCQDMLKKWKGSDVCCTHQNGDVSVTGRQGHTYACSQ